MGWSNGSELMGSIISSLNKSQLSDDIREAIYRDIIPTYLDADCDTLDECQGVDEVFDRVLDELW